MLSTLYQIVCRSRFGIDESSALFDGFVDFNGKFEYCANMDCSIWIDSSRSLTHSEYPFDLQGPGVHQFERGGLVEGT